MSGDSLLPTGGSDLVADAPMALVPGAFVRFLSLDHVPRARMLVNSGVQLAGRNDYVGEGFVPRRDWRALSDNEIGILLSESSDALESEQISIVSLPEELMHSFKSITASIEKYNDPKAASNAFTHGSFSRGRSQLVRFMEEMGATQVRYLGHSLIAPNSVSTSLRPDGLHVGMHVDSYLNPTVSERRDGYPSRLCLNIGPEPRYFQFMNLTLRQMVGLMPHPTEQDPNLFATKFLNAFANYPVVQVELMPGEAYVAPTEIMIHDGSTLPKQFFDATVTLLGAFNRLSVSNMALRGAGLTALDKPAAV